MRPSFEKIRPNRQGPAVERSAFQTTSLLKVGARAYNKAMRNAGYNQVFLGTTRVFPKRTTAIQSCAVRCLLVVVMLAAGTRGARAQQQQLENEIVANLAGGRVIVHVSREQTTFAVIDQPLEVNSAPPRVLSLDGTHVGVLFGAEEWQLSGDPHPVRLDRNFQRIGKQDPRYQSYNDQAEPDLEMIGVGFLEKLRPLVGQLHTKLQVKPDDPIFEVVVIGYALNYGPEVWQVEYRIEQDEVGARGKDYWQTRVLRPRFTQLYPPEGKHTPRTLVEVRFPDDASDPELRSLIERNDPRIERLRSSDQRFAKVLQAIDKGEAQKAVDQDAADLLRAIVPLLAGDRKFVVGTISEQQGFDWVVAPDEPIEKAVEDKNQPPEAPTLRRKPKSP